MRETRYSGLVPVQALRDTPVTVVGVGAIGRALALGLAGVGVRHLTLIDPDEVDEVNLGPQGYKPGQIGMPKVAALAEDIRALNPEEVAVREIQSPFRADLLDTPVAFAAVDRMDARRVIWEAQPRLLVDGRMGGLTLRVLAFDARHWGDYGTEERLFTEDEAEALPCTQRSAPWTSGLAVGLMLYQWTRWLRGEPVASDQLMNLWAGELVQMVDQSEMEEDLVPATA